MVQLSLYWRIKSGEVKVHSGSPDDYRFWRGIDKQGEDHPTLGRCWKWVRSKSRRGYGKLVTAMGLTAHRYPWWKHYGEIPTGMCVLHRCDNPECTRPDHLFLGTDKDNVRDRDSKNRQMQGEDHCLAKLTAADVMWIRKHCVLGCSKYGYRPLSRKFGVTHRSIRLVMENKTWKGLV